MSNFKVKNGLKVGANGIIFNDATTQNTAITNLNSLSDVTLTSPSNNQFLRYNASSGVWENQTYASIGGAEGAQETANIAYDQANSAYSRANTAYDQANSAYNQANTKISLTSISNTSPILYDNSNGTISFAISGVTTGTYGSASQISQITVDTYGRITQSSNVSIAISSSAVSGLATSATVDTTNASNISIGTLANARTTASSSNGASTIVSRDASGNFTANTVTVNSDLIVNGTTQTRSVIYTNASSITINSANTDLAIQTNTLSAGTLTINAPSGSPSNGQKILIRLQCTNVQTLSFNAIFQGSTELALPTSTSGSSKYDYMGFIYNSTANKWQLLAKMFGF